MNKSRRSALQIIITELEAMNNTREKLQEELMEIVAQEQEAFDNTPENMQGSDRCQHMQECIDSLQCVAYELDTCDMENLLDQLREIVEV